MSPVQISINGKDAGTSTAGESIIYNTAATVIYNGDSYRTGRVLNKDGTDAGWFDIRTSEFETILANKRMIPPIEAGQEPTPVGDRVIIRFKEK
jgi:hypothetical protein